jgi:hypothetical protein
MTDNPTAAVARLEQENKELAREALQLAAERTFILGNDIPETVERARAVLVQRVRDAEIRAASSERGFCLYRRLVGCIIEALEFYDSDDGHNDLVLAGIIAGAKQIESEKEQRDQEKQGTDHE